MLELAEKIIYARFMILKKGDHMFFTFFRIRSARLVFVLGLTCCSFSYVQAQTTGSTSAQKLPTANPSKDPISGFQVGLRKGTEQKITVESEFLGRTYKGSSKDFEHEIGLSLGYAKNEDQSFGFKGGLNLDIFKDDEDSSHLSALNVDANATFTLNNSFIPFAGVNFNKYLNTDYNKLDPSLGYQFGVTGQIWQQVGYQLSYQAIRNTGDVESVEYKTEIRMVQFGIIFTI